MDHVVQSRDHHAGRLLELTGEVDFAAFVFARDDWTNAGAASADGAEHGQPSPRDNVVLEAGLFGGVLGMRRTFILHASGAKLPSDLLGLTCARYGEATSAAEVRALNEKIRAAIESEGALARIEGAWWQFCQTERTASEPSAVSLLRIVRGHDRSLELSGRAWQEDGTLSARYWSEAAKERKDPAGLFYDWRDERPRHANAPRLEGSGEIRLEPAERAAGHWCTPGLNARTSGVYLQAAPEDVAILEGNHGPRRSEARRRAAGPLEGNRQRVRAKAAVSRGQALTKRPAHSRRVRTVTLAPGGSLVPHRLPQGAAMFQFRPFHAVLAGAVLAACGGAEEVPVDLTSAQLELSSTPAGVKCLVVTASVSGHSETWGLPLASTTTPTTIALDDVPVGKTKFEAAAYPAACKDDGPADGDVAAWVSTPAFFDILAGRSNKVSLLLHPPSGSVDGDVSFQVPVVDVALGETASYAVLANGQVWGWGLGTDGQLGSENKSRMRPYLIPGVPYMTHIAAGRLHACGIAAADGSVWCWGGGQKGQLGTGTAPGSNAPPAKAGPARVNLDFVEPGTTEVVPGIAIAIAAGETHSCALLAPVGTGGARLSCWGAHKDQLNPAGMQLVPSTPTTGTIATSGGFVDVRAAGSGTCALTGFGATRCWVLANAGAGPPNVFSNAMDEGQNGMISIDLGSGRFGARADGQVVTWSRGADAPTAPVLVPGITDAIQIAAAGSSQGLAGPSKPHVCALRSTGGVKCWGTDAKQGQLGNGSGEGSATPVNVLGLSDAIFVASGRSRSCAIVENGALYCWGENVAGVLGLGDHVSRFVPTRVVF